MNSVERRARVMAWAMVIVTAPGLIVNPATAATYWWDGGAGDGNWSTVNNWSTVQAGGDNPAAVPGSGDTVYLNADTTGGQISSLNGNQAAYGITFRANTTTGITIANNTLTLGAGGLTIENGAAAHTINSAIALGAAQAWANNSANALTAGGTIANGGYTLTITGSGTTTISINISGTGGITKTGSGTWNATYAPGTDQGYTFTGPVVIEAGNVETATATYIGTFKNASSVTIGGGAIAAQLKVSSLAGLFYTTRKTVTLKTNGKLTMGNNNTVHLFDLTFEGGELASGTGRYAGSYPSWQLNGDITVTANTGVSTMSAHWMAFTNYLPPNNSDSDITFNVGANSTLNVTGVFETSNGYANPFIKAGDGLMILAPDNGEASGTINTYTSPTKITGGVLRLSQQKAIPGGIGSAGGTRNIELAGGVVEMNYDGFMRGLGTGTTQVQFTGDGGFSACGATRIVNLGGSVTPGGVTWASGSFVPNGNKLLLSSTVANATVDFQNPIDLNGAARTVDVRDGSAAVDAKLTGVLSGSGSSGLSKTGAGTLELAASVTHTYAGATQVNGGTLLLSGAGSINSSSGITVNGSGARLITTSSAAVTAQITMTQGTIGGTGTISATGGVSIGANAILAPGNNNNPGTQNYSTSLTWSGGGTYQWEINDTSGAVGANPGWDLLTGSTLNISATSGNKFTIDITSLNGSSPGDTASFNRNRSYKWKIADFDNTISGFDANAVTLLRTHLSNSNTGTWAIKRGDASGVGGDNTELWLTYDPPGTVIMFR